MKYIRLFESFGSGELPYQDWELGIIKAWGDLLYLSFHSVPQRIREERLVSERVFRNEFRNYLNNSEGDEDLLEWMAEAPPTYDRGRLALFDRERLGGALTDMADRTRLEEPLVIWRSEMVDGAGWNSFTTNPSLAYEGTKKSYLLPVGTPVVFCGELADPDEVIVHLTSEQKAEWLMAGSGAGLPSDKHN